MHASYHFIQLYFAKREILVARVLHNQRQPAVEMMNSEIRIHEEQGKLNFSPLCSIKILKNMLRIHLELVKSELVRYE